MTAKPSEGHDQMQRAVHADTRDVEPPWARVAVRGGADGDGHEALGAKRVSGASSGTRLLPRASGCFGLPSWVLPMQ